MIRRALLCSVARVVLGGGDLPAAVLRLSAVCLATAGLAPAGAQVAAPPVHQNIDGNGVDLVLDTFNTSSTDVLIGPGGAMGMAYTRFFNGSGWRDSLVATISGGTSSYDPVYVSIGGSSDAFTGDYTSGYTSMTGNGATLTRPGGGSYIYTNAEGVVATFTPANGQYDRYVANGGWVQSITYPNGVKWFYTYKGQLYCPDDESPCPVPLARSNRLQSVTNNLGYQLKLTYASNTLTHESQLDAWQTITSVTGINNTIDYCDPSADTCALTQSWPTASYSTVTTASATIESVTDAAGKVKTYTYTVGGGSLVGIRRPGATTDNITIAYGGDGVSSVTNAGVTYNYAVSDVGTTRTTTVTGPLSFHRVVVSDTATSLVSSDTDSLGRTTAYAYDGDGRVTQVAAPEGNAVQYTYDPRGNVTLTTVVAKSGSGLANLTTSAIFPACTGTNQVTCNQPSSTTDARGNTTDYMYDPTHGGVLSITAPAPTTGATRPQARYSYESRQAYYKQSSGAAPSAGTAIDLPVSTSACRTGSSCAGTNDEVLTTLDYGPQMSGTANNLLPVSTTSGSGNASGAGALRATTTLAYDQIGNVVQTDGPLAGSGDVVTRFYDADRRPVRVVGPDPYGNGHYRAQRIDYNADGTTSAVEQGTTTGRGGSDPFTRLLRQQVDYDQYGRRVSATAVDVTSGATALAMTQWGYDALGRADCTAQRMNQATYGALPAACTLAATGTFGPDRIAKTLYDAAGQATGQIIALGTSEQTLEAQMSWTANGRLASVTDGNNNLTSYAYDGFDRALRTCYLAAVAACSANTAPDYEQLGYDEASNVTVRRVRDGQTIAYGYDALNRVTSQTPTVPQYGVKASYAYDNLGELTNLNDLYSAFSSTFGYDALGRKTSEGGPFVTLTTGYDLAGRRTSLDYGDGYSVGYTRLVTGELTGVYENQAAGAPLATFAYDDLGRRTTLARPNGRGSGYGYDGISRLRTLSTQVAAGTTTATLDYNPAGQIVGRQTDNDIVVSNAASNVERSYATNGLNQYTRAGAIGIAHDARGNTTRLAADTYGYDVLNQLYIHNGAGGGDYFYHDPAGRMVVQTSPGGVRYSIYDGQDLIAERDDTGTIRRYVHGDGADEPLVWYEGAGTSDRRWLAADERGSITAITNGAGATLAIDQYDDWGIPAPGNIGRFQYTGQRWFPELKAYDYKARIYMPLTGRFMQTDPIGFGDGLNLYRYVRNDPLNGVDPSGLAGYERDHLVNPTLRAREDARSEGLSGRTTGSLSGAGTASPVSHVSGILGFTNEGNSQTGRSGGVSSLGNQVIITANTQATSGPLVSGIGGFNLEQQSIILASASGTPNPPNGLPGGPYTAKPNSPGNKPGSFQGPKQPSGPRPQAQYVPPESEGGPPGSPGYFKTQMPGQKGFDRFDLNGNPLTPDQAHPNPIGPTRSFLFFGPVGAIICTLFCESPAY